MPTILIALAGALGAVLRYRIGVAVGVRSFPWSTLAINITGCFLIAFVVAGPLASRWSESTTSAIAVGFLGAYTTFSTFGYETFMLWKAGRVGAAAGYVALSVAVGLAATAAGYAAGRAFS